VSEAILARLVETIHRTRAGESATQIANALDVSPRSVQRMRTAAAVMGHLPRVFPTVALPWRTKACRECGEQYGPRLTPDGSRDWSAWRRSTVCSVVCKMRRARAARYQRRAWERA